MICRKSFALLFVALTAAACRDSMTGVTAFGPVPVVTVDRAFGEAPLKGHVHITPAPSSGGWRWRVTFPGNRGAIREGEADAPVSLRYRFSVPGVHPIRIELTGPEGTVVVEEHVVVHDQATDLEVVARRSLADIPIDSPEGLAIDVDGEKVYTAPYPAAEILQLDAETFEVLDRLPLPRYRVQGIAVTPSGGHLLTVHVKQGLGVVDLDAFEVTDANGPGRGWIRSWDDERALVADFGAGTGEGLRRVDFVRSRIESAAEGFVPGVFDVDHARVFLAVVNYSTYKVDILEAGSLTRLRSISLEGFRPFVVAFDPTDAMLYVLADGDSGDARFFLVDPASGNVIRSVDIGPIEQGYISYNPFAAFSGGRYVALNNGASVVIVDTQLDIPRFRLAPEEGEAAYWASVAAVFDSEFLYVLTGGRGSLRKIRVR